MSEWMISCAKFEELVALIRKKKENVADDKQSPPPTNPHPPSSFFSFTVKTLSSLYTSSPLKILFIYCLPAPGLSTQPEPSRVRLQFCDHPDWSPSVSCGPPLWWRTGAERSGALTAPPQSGKSAQPLPRSVHGGGGGGGAITLGLQMGFPQEGHAPHFSRRRRGQMWRQTQFCVAMIPRAATLDNGENRRFLSSLCASGPKASC